MKGSYSQGKKGAVVVDAAAPRLLSLIIFIISILLFIKHFFNIGFLLITILSFVQVKLNYGDKSNE